MQTLRNAENTRSFNNDKGIIRLPRQHLYFTIQTGQNKLSVAIAV